MKLSTKIWIILSIVIGIDMLFITPLGIKYFNCEEVNPYHNIGIDYMGLTYFYIAFPISMLFLFFIIRGLESCCYEHIESEKQKNIPLYVAVVFGVIAFSYTIISNIFEIMK